MSMTVNWPVSQNIEGVLGTMNDMFDSTYVKGLIPKLMQPLDNIVIFAYKGTSTEEIEFIDIFREEPLKAFKDSSLGVCSFLRKKYEDSNIDWYTQICLKNDTRAVSYAYSLHDEDDAQTQPPQGWKEVTIYEGIPIYKYTCEETCFIELIAPVLVEFGKDEEGNTIRKMIGAFVSGQYKDIEKAFDITDTCCAIVNTRANLFDLDEDEKALLETEIEQVYEKNKRMPSEDKLLDFLKMIYEFSKMLSTRYVELLHSHSMRLQNIIDEAIWENGKNINLIQDIDDYAQRLDNLNTRLTDGLHHLLKETGFTRIFLATPKLNLESIEHLSQSDKHSHLISQWVDLSDASDTWVPEIVLQTKYWKTITSDETNNILLKSGTISSYNNNEETFLNELEKLFNGIKTYVNRSGIKITSFGYFIFATQRHRNYPLIFLLQDSNPNRWCDKVIIREVFESAAEKYLAQWNEIYSDYQRNLVEISAGYIDHELGQIQSGIESLAREAMDSYKPLANWIKEIKGTNANTELHEAAYKTKDFAKDILTFSKLTELISKHQLTSMFSTEPNYSSFLPYGEVLYELNAVYYGQCVREGKHVVIPKMEKVRANPGYSPKMNTDKNIFMIIVNNLFRNAVKYSWPGSNIFVDCRLDKKTNYWTIAFINYGRPISLTDKVEIFKFQTRGENAVGVKGMGIGLYLIKYLVDLLDGTVNFNHREVSKMCVPALQYFTKETEPFIPKEKYELYLNEYRTLSKTSEYGRIVNRPYGKLVWREVEGMINTPTVEFQFIVKIPNISMEG